MDSRTSRRAGTGRHAIVAVTGLTLLVLLLSSCAAGANVAAGGGPDDAGFLLGLWHGIIAPFAFVVSLFSDSVGIYEVHNNGGWYDFGFVLGLSVIFSGGGAGAKGRSRS